MAIHALRAKLLLKATWEGVSQKIKAEAMRSSESLIQEVKKAGLAGRGGGFFPVAKKWEIARMEDRPVYLVVNGGSGGMGNLKNRFFLSRLAMPLIAGVKIVQAALHPEKTFFYLSRHYQSFLPDLQKAAQELNCALVFHLGSYHPINGEETAILEELEGKFPRPRKRPPYPAVKGYFYQPTIVHSLEVFLHLAYGFAYGWEKWLEFGDQNLSGTFVLSLSGDVRQPGVVEVAFGEPLSLLFDQQLLGPAHLFFMGGEGGCFVPHGKDLSFSLGEEGFQPGLGNVVAVSETRCLFRLAYTLAKAQEKTSCGKCAACVMANHNIAFHIKNAYQGTEREKALEYVDEIVRFMPDHGDCHFINSCAAIFQGLIQTEDFRQHREGRCHKCTR